METRVKDPASTLPIFKLFYSIYFKYTTLYIMETRVKDPASPKLYLNSTTPFTTIYNIIYNGDNNFKI